MEYHVQFWVPPVQERHGQTSASPAKATNVIRALAHMTYEEGLRDLVLLSLKKRRLRGDLITVYS